MLTHAALFCQTSISLVLRVFSPTIVRLHIVSTWIVDHHMTRTLRLLFRYRTQARTTHFSIFLDPSFKNPNPITHPLECHILKLVGIR